MTRRYEQLKDLVAFIKPKRIIEVGTNKGKSAELICREALKYHNQVHYVGYDLFEDATAETDRAEFNGKTHGVLAEVRARLEAIPGVNVELIKGNTRDTLHGKDERADFVFIDGGHSVETIAGDFDAVKASRLIVFDDYYTPADPNFGCNAVLNVPHEVLPQEDRGKGGIGIQLAVVGYSTKAKKAIEKCCKDDGHKTVSVWRGGEVMPADLVCAVNTLELCPDVDAALEQLRKLIRKRLFFVIKRDALRSLDSWREKMGRYFHLLEWFADAHQAEVWGTAMPLFVVGEWESRGVLGEDKRFEQVVANVTATAKRVRPVEQPHERKAVIVCFGPSLQQSWPVINGEKRFADADVFSVSGAHDFLIRRNLKPDFHVECDPRPHKAENLTNPSEGVQYLIASCCHPDLVNKLKGFDLTLWHLCNGQDSFRILEEIESEKEQCMITGGGSVGLRTIALAYALGYRNFTLYGMDCSFSPGFTDLEELRKYPERQWAGRHKGKQKKVIEIRCGDKWFKTSPVDVTYARHFFDTLQRAPGATFNLMGDGLLQEMAKRAKEEANEEAA